MRPRQLIARAADLLFPLRCAGCGAFDTPLCARCGADLVPATGPGRCGFCSAAWDGEGFCPRCFGWRELAGVRAVYEHTGAARALVHRLKYERYRALAPLMANRLAAAAAALPVDGWVAVPLHRRRERERGFNQAELLLRRAGLPPAPARLRRLRHTGSQVRRTAAERAAALAGAFACDGPPLDGLRIGIIDDVITSGATVRECARALRDRGAREVWAFSFTRASLDLARPDSPIDH
ncbi:double zinc ribbon domain-containing protein [Tepidiforma flava]|uniref:Double zinc ribbon domain-containing protein n=1 Tax=Tepidiforma flava TaxID=3004094 RepID=A0ABY7M884_9CHLR|nr:double zinc ribbon domain-containing protein [Tepidiforma flava]WBL36728.1 double zinc ribbon domain-containing protein [Tepidiforma flava]